MQGLLLPFVAVLFAELFDKSQLAILLLASRSKHHLQLLAGTVFAFAIVDGLAILVGSWLTGIVPENTLKTISGIAFIIFGVLALRGGKGEGQAAQTTRGAFVSGFLAVFLSEWGDKTQLASAVFATQFQPFLVFIGVLTALTALSAVAVYLGKILAKKIDRAIIGRVSGIIFILLGMYFLLP